MRSHKHVHSSGRYDRTAAQVRRNLIKYIKRDGAAVITLTECGGSRHRAVIRSVARRYGYSVHQGATGQDDCVILLRKNRYRAAHQWADKLTDMPQNRAKGGPIHHAITVLAEDLLTGTSDSPFVLYTVTHLTAGVEGDWREKVYRVRVWLDAHRTWARLTLKRRKRFKVKVAMVADWNLNFKKARFRALVKNLHPMLRLTWRKFGSGGTHHWRIIDGTLTNMLIIKPAELLEDDDFADHRPYAETLGV